LKHEWAVLPLGIIEAAIPDVAIAIAILFWLLSYGGRLILINLVLSSLPMFMLSFFEVPRGVLKKIDYFRSKFFWQNKQHKKKYRLARWNILCQPRDQGGMWIHNLDIQNKCLLCKLLFKLCNEDGLWQEHLRNKYLKGQSLSQIEKKSRRIVFLIRPYGCQEPFP
jgi:hypothetical protein